MPRSQLSLPPPLRPPPLVAPRPAAGRLRAFICGPGGREPGPRGLPEPERSAPRRQGLVAEFSLLARASPEPRAGRRSVRREDGHPRVHRLLLGIRGVNLG
nr:SH3 domain-binding glutamic acid-rich-like protein 2 isoform X3 [Equus caballus]